MDFKRIKIMEQEIIKLMRGYGYDKIKLVVLIDLGDEFDADLELYPIVADVVEIRAGEVYIYDEADEDENGEIAPMYKLTKLSDDIQKEVKWALVETLIAKCKD